MSFVFSNLNTLTVPGTHPTVPAESTSNIHKPEQPFFRLFVSVEKSLPPFLIVFQKWPNNVFLTVLPARLSFRHPNK